MATTRLAVGKSFLDDSAAWSVKQARRVLEFWCCST
ncbi:hypothetical protein SOVF_202880 [Spinacia oleracea]|nr:hypothetical protein SOVF_202880 [Spinacia oleracea]